MGISKIHSIFTERRQFNDWASHPLKTTRLKKDVMSDLPEKMLCFKKMESFCEPDSMILDLECKFFKMPSVLNIKWLSSVIKWILYNRQFHQFMTRRDSYFCLGCWKFAEDLQSSKVSPVRGATEAVWCRAREGQTLGETEENTST